ncbi:MAG: HAMP domain-containing histidine kinase [Bacteroidales bacterium]|jgi:signal transduction histidine kinase|nr:HAMP domain-containing histidine kinase [Bacteroidales bacterium]
MKKRWIFPILFILSLTTVFLLMAIFQLYTEAEKVQKSIFANEVLTAGETIVQKIEAILQGDTLDKIQGDTLSEEFVRSTPSSFTKYARQFIMDSASQKPIGVIRSLISYTSNNITVIKYDTTYFDTNYRNQFRYIPTEWESDAATGRHLENTTRGRKHGHGRLNMDKLEMDSNTINLLNRELLNRLVMEALGDVARHYTHDFALYNAITTNFVVPPAQNTPEQLLKSDYVFRLKENNHFSAPHYFIIYFPAERGIYFHMMKNIAFLILIFLGLIFFISGMTLIYLYRQKKWSDIRDDFVNNITHEFKTPIATIALASEAMSDQSIEENPVLRKSYISIIKDENERLQKMVHDILQLAQLKKGQLKMNVEKINIHDMIKWVVESVALQISSREGTLVLKLAATRPVIYGDSTHIGNVLINLVENAIKYSKEIPDIEISTHDEHGQLVIAVRDHGIGISKQNIKRVFQEFYRVSKGNIHDTKGFGLGLDYVKKIISLHGGNITVKSELNKGSVFTLYLPNKK